jgi:hypothetical protein
MNSSLHVYLEDTRTAIEQLFAALDYYRGILQSVRPRVMATSVSEALDPEAVTEKWVQENDEAINASIVQLRRYIAHLNSRQAICGAVLQIAYMGMKLYCVPGLPPDNFKDAIPRSKQAKETFLRFCRGRQVRGVPLGLVIYAGRNQYNHYDDPDLSRANQVVFQTLAANHGLPGAEGILDPAFNLDNAPLRIYSSNLVSIIGWDTEFSFRGDMEILLNNST